MRLSRITAPVATGVLSLLALAGCYQLNHGKGPTQDPFFSIADAEKAQPRDLTSSRKLPQPILQIASDVSTR